jgi:hypothetical protein
MIHNFSFALIAIHLIGTFFHAPAPIQFSNDLFPVSSILQVTMPSIPNNVNKYFPPIHLAQTLTPVDDEYEVNQDEELSVPAPGVLENDVFDGEVSAILEQAPQNGDITFDSDGSFTYIPEAGFVGTDEFSYLLVQGELLSDPGLVMIRVRDTQAPLVTWISPVSEGEYLIVGHEVVQLEAQATDNGSLAGVQFKWWNPILGQDGEYVYFDFLETPPYQMELNTRDLNPEWNQIVVQATDTAGNMSDSPFIWLYMIPPTYKFYTPILYNENLLFTND